MKPRASTRDMLDAIEHADVEGDQEWTLDDFNVLPMGPQPMSRVLSYDDSAAWLDVDPRDFDGLSPEERLAELASFRGPEWAARAAQWVANGVPPIVVIDAPVGDPEHLYQQIGDGRGRVNFALAMGLKTLPVVILKWKHPLTRANPSLKPHSISTQAARLLAGDIGLKGLRPDELEAFRRGLEIEHEHFGSVNGSWNTIAKITADHLDEDPDYYTKLDYWEAYASEVDLEDL
ncbi:MAG: hypothetical protein QG602_416 [Verrucomicrobiota bacterium]|nr:hypothetical protein [Verrucomicrobiota bacterium]